MTPRRVAYVVNVFPKFSETFIANELAELRRRGVEVCILSLRRPDENEPTHEIVTRSGLLLQAVYDRAQFSRMLQELQPDLIHAHFATEPAATARQLTAELGLPFTFTTHAYDIYRRPPKDFAERAAAACAVITVSEANAQYITQTFGVPPQCLHVIPCGIDTEQFRPGSSQGMPPHIVCVARMVPVKNQALLLEACADLKRRGLEFRCVLVGDGRSREEIQANRARLGLAGTVDIVGVATQADVLKWWHRAAIAALPSHSEGMPVALMEAAACGLPAVATAVGGVPELVEDGETGFVIKPGDALTFANALERLLVDPEMAAHMGVAARRRAQERFSVHLQVDRLLALWSDVLSEDSAA
jgi:glycosyltransferase involved in cell wall biosynthesis